MRQLDQIILKDNETDTGGINHVGETLLEFLETIGFEVEDKLAITIREVAQINIRLADCGIKKLELEDFLDNPNPQSNNTETSMKFDAGKTQYHLLVPSSCCLNTNCTCFLLFGDNINRSAEGIWAINARHRTLKQFHTNYIG